MTIFIIISITNFSTHRSIFSFRYNLNIISLITSASREQGRKEVTITVDLTHVGMDIVEDLRKEGYDVVNISTSKVRA